MNIRNRELSCRAVTLLALLIFAVGIAAGVFGWIWITGGGGEPSRTMAEALAEFEATNDAANTALSEEVAAIIPPAIGTAVSQAVATAIPQAINAAFPGAAVVLDADDAVEASEAESNIIEFQIVPAESQATFTLEEDLRGARTTVIGLTREVGGAVMVNLDNPAASSIGAIVINARTLETDNSFRNRALRSSILKSAEDAYEFITFEPRSLTNFSAESVSVGDTLAFDVIGDLTVAGVTRTLAFHASVTLDSRTQISGRASANVLHADYNLTIPEVPSVTNVTDDVDLAIEFVAIALR